MPSGLPQKIIEQINGAGLPTAGRHSFNPRLTRNKKGKPIIQKKTVQKGRKKGKKGFVDDQDRIWVRDRSHAGLPDHWDVQLNEGADYMRIGMDGEEITSSFQNKTEEI